MNDILDPKRHQFFRANIGVIVINEDGKVLALSRSDLPGRWQLPQGGLNQDESFREAALRELFEETGIPSEKVQYVAEHPQWLYYELPENYRSSKNGRGQIQKWLLWFMDEPEEIDLSKAPDKEFDKYDWISFSQLVEKVVYFRKPVYKELAKYFANFLADE